MTKAAGEDKYVVLLRDAVLKPVPGDATCHS
jgi:hypothetical protein